MCPDDDDFSVSPELAAELDRRLSEHLADPASAVPWEIVERKLKDGARPDDEERP